MRLHIFALLVLASAVPANGSDIVNFEIVNSSSFSTGGGIFTSGGGTFSGQFQVDVSRIPPDGSALEFSLTSWDILTMLPGGLNIEFDPGNSGGDFDATAEENIPGFGLRQQDAVLFTEIVGSNIYQLTLSMIEPVGIFHGGLVLEASDTDNPPFGPSIEYSDALGTALVLDPAVFSPEPGSAWIMAAGLTACFGARRWFLRGTRRP